MGRFNELLEEQNTNEYLPEGHSTVTITKAEIKYGDDARPKWATKSIQFMFANDEGIAFWECELEPLKKQDGTDNEMAVTIAMGNLEKMGLEWGDVKTIEDFAEEAERFVMSGAPLGAEVVINIVGKDSDNINPKTNKPYRRINVYVNKLVEPGAGGMSSSEPEVAVF